MDSLTLSKFLFGTITTKVNHLLVSLTSMISASGKSFDFLSTLSQR